MRRFRKNRNLIAIVSCLLLLGGHLSYVYAGDEDTAGETSYDDDEALLADGQSSTEDVQSSTEDAQTPADGQEIVTAAEEQEPAAAREDEDQTHGYGYAELEGEKNAALIDNGLSYSEMRAALVDEDAAAAEPELSLMQAYSAAVSAITPSAGVGIPTAYPAPYEEEETWLGFLQEHFPAPRNQASSGTCWAHSAIGIAEFYAITHGLAEKDVDYSELHLVNFTYTNDSKLVAGDTGDRVTVAAQSNKLLAGNLIPAMQTLMHQRGVALESTLPYDKRDSLESVDASMDREDVLWIENGYLIGINNREQIKEAIQKNGAVSVSYKDSNTYYNEPHNSYYNDGDTVGENHAVMVVGWDDAFPKENFGKTVSEDGAWLIRNSWSTSVNASHSSYFWMSYEDKSLSDGWVFEMTDKNPCDNNYFYDAQMHNESSLVYDGEATVYSANIFRVNGAVGAEKERLDAISFQAPFSWVKDSGTDFSVSVYTSSKKMKTPTGGTLAQNATASGTVYYQGTYTIPLKESVELNRGDYFSVVIKAANSTVSTEREIANWGKLGIASSVDGQAGQSFYKEESDASWTDYGEKYKRNLVISALTFDLLEDAQIPASLSVNPEAYTFDGIGEEFKIETTVYNDKEEPISDAKISFLSGDTSVAVVDANGLVRSVGAGSTSILVKCGNAGKSIRVEVVPALYVEFSEGDSFTYTGAAITPPVAVYKDGDKLCAGIDYSVKYANNKNASTTAADSKKPKVTITGISFAASVTKNFEIREKSLSSNDITAAGLVCKKGAKPAPQLYDGSTKLTSASFSYESKALDQTSVLIIRGKGNYTGTKSLTISVLDDVASTKIRIERFKPDIRIYNGEEQPALRTSEDQSGNMPELIVNASKGGDALVAGEDYDVIYPTDLTNAGSIKVQIVGKGSYTGTITKSFKIQPLAAGAEAFTLTLSETVLPYDPAGAKPVPTVKYGQTELSFNKDYSFSYSKHKKVGKEAFVTIKFIGNYKGSAKLKAPYEVTALAMTNENTRVLGLDKIAGSKAKLYTKPYVEVNGLRITSFSVLEYKTGPADLPASSAGELLAPAATHYSSASLVTVTVAGKGNYSGTVTGKYYIYDISNSANAYDLSKAKLSIVDDGGKTVKAYAYTGGRIEVNTDAGHSVSLKVKSGKEWITVPPDCYQLDYVANINKGTAYVLVNGKGVDDTSGRYYYGGKAGSFKIVKGIVGWL